MMFACQLGLPSQLLLCQLQTNTLSTGAYTQVLTCLHGALQAVDLNDPLLRVSVGLRLALHLEAANENVSATSMLKEVSTCKLQWLCRRSCLQLLFRVTAASCCIWPFSIQGMT